MNKSFRHAPKSLFLLALLLVPIAAAAQRESTTLFGVGKSNLYDTYLSPVEYRGPQVSVLHLTERTLKRDSALTFQTITQLEYVSTENAAKTSKEMDFAIHFDAGWHYNWHNVLLPGLNMELGGLFGGDFGGIYNQRNQNNPAQARASMEISASAGAAYSFRIRKRCLSLRYQADLPLVGGMFSPRYGQSYYNIFGQGNYDHNIVPTHLGNALSLRQMFAVSIPVKRRAVTIGYFSDLRQSKPHHLRQHQYSRNFIIGWTL